MAHLLQNAVAGSGLILAVVVLRRVLKARLLPEVRLGLWAVCLFRLLTPVAPKSALSLYGLARSLAPKGQPAPTPLPPASPLPPPSAYVTVPGPAPVEPGFPWDTALIAVWLAVAGVLTVRYVLSWTRTKQAVACAIPLDRDDPQYAILPKCARLRVGPMEGAPLTFGAVRPTVVLSPGLSGEELDYVLVHEGVHATRRDNLWHYAMALVLAVFWWDPLVWLMARLLRQDIELSCDRAVLRILGADRRAGYARALVSLSAQAGGPAFCHTFGRKATEERIRSIMRFKKTSLLGIVLSLTLVLGVTAAFASDPIDKNAPASGPDASGTPLPDGVQDLQPDPSAVDPDDGFDQLYLEDDNGLIDVQVRTSSGSYALCDAEDCPEAEPHCHIDGMVVRAYLEYPGLLCAKPDCEEEDVHEHDGVTYYGQAGNFTILDPELGPVPSALPEQAAPTAAQLTITPIQSDCVEECTETRLHQHANGRTVLLPTACPVEGCTVQGSHHHGDTFYTCNGHHSGGVCDRSCLATLPSPVSGHHSEDHHSSHH